MVISLSKGGIGFFDISTGNEIGSRIPTAEYSMISSSPDGRRIVTCHEDQRALDIWNVRPRALAKELEHRKIKRIAFSVDGKKVMIITSPNHHRRLVAPGAQEVHQEAYTDTTQHESSTRRGCTTPALGRPRGHAVFLPKLQHILVLL